MFIMEETGGEFYIFLKVLISIYLSLCYCHIVGKFLTNIMLRLCAVLPVIFLFLSLPLILSSVYFIGITSFFISWLANFKLLQFAFKRGPLYIDSSISSGRFVALASFPIKIQHKKLKEESNKQNPVLKVSQNSFLKYFTKVVFLVLLVWNFKYRDYIHPNLFLVLSIMQIYLFLDLALAMAASCFRYLLGEEIEPQFNNPHLSHSLHNFWGRRWNIMVSRTLHSTVYEPLRNRFTSVIDRRWASLPAIFLTFSVSGLMHELIYYYLGRVKPTWEVTWFFFLHGFCVMVEIGLKKAHLWKLQLPRLVSIPLTVGFVVVTCLWLFLPQLLRSKAQARAFEECVLAVSMGKEIFSKWIKTA